jgi:hypothetical protein
MFICAARTRVCMCVCVYERKSVCVCRCARPNACWQLSPVGPRGRTPQRSKEHARARRPRTLLCLPG